MRVGEVRNKRGREKLSFPCSDTVGPGELGKLHG